MSLGLSAQQAVCCLPLGRMLVSSEALSFAASLGSEASAGCPGRRGTLSSSGFWQEEELWDGLQAAKDSTAHDTSHKTDKGCPTLCPALC